MIQVKDEKHECSLGTLTLPLSHLLEAEGMTLHQRFPLKNSGPSCTIKMKMALRVRSDTTRWRSPFTFAVKDLILVVVGIKSSSWNICVSFFSDYFADSSVHFLFD